MSDEWSMRLARIRAHGGVVEARLYHRIGHASLADGSRPVNAQYLRESLERAKRLVGYSTVTLRLPPRSPNTLR